MKRTCLACSCAMRVRPVDARFFDDYALYAHDAGGQFEVRRQDSYAAWIASVAEAPESVFEAGCGNGSLMLALRKWWPSAELTGCEPARGAAEHAHRAGLDVEIGYLEDAESAKSPTELALSVNVLEHVPDPVSFLRALARRARRDVVVVCPNGEVPNIELLFSDHLSSLTRSNLAILFAAAGLRVVRQEAAPASLGEFIITVGRSTQSVTIPRLAQPPVVRARFDYLRAWEMLDDQLIARIGNSAVTCFGAGEAAALLRTYAPQSWAHVEACTADEFTETAFGKIPVVAYETLPPRTILLGTRPSVQPALTTRLVHDGHRVVSWSDLIAA
jgi:SAM-dependent methyltransferase